MSNVPISEAFVAAKRRLVGVLWEFLPARLDQAAADHPGFEFPHPETIITAKSDPHSTFSKLNLERAALWVTRERPTQSIQDRSGDGQRRSKTQDVQIRVTSFVRDPNIPDLPDHDAMPRAMVAEEYLADRAEYYNGAIIDVITRRAPTPGGVVGDATIDADSAEWAEVSRLGKVSTSAAIFGISQDVLVKTP